MRYDGCLLRHYILWFIALVLDFCSTIVLAFSSREFLSIMNDEFLFLATIYGYLITSRRHAAYLDFHLLVGRTCSLRRHGAWRVL
ncbi:hypothetical protein EUGRSUZ_J00830 [Eucalyptus grandis]|uniref:Uncharacterized protein n=2 Tax=Eucalyptus grandis TaxID=71139 RepID=A0A059AC70_EUCGR|nr:hypothetical protein EUGRSUZ_J00830 [Eucalyptus grandis]